MTAASLAVPATARRRGVLLVVTGVLLAVAVLALNAMAEHTLNGRPPVDLGPLQLQLVHNPGVAFSLGDRLPSGLVLAVTGAITLAVLLAAARMGRSGSRLARAGVVAVLAGAIANLLDRATDGVVTDYFHTGWFPTFNLADILITLGAGLVILRTATQPEPPENG